MRTWFTELQPQQQPRANMTSPVMPNARQGCSAHTHVYKRLVSTAAQHQPHTQETYPIVLPNLCRCHNATREPHQRPPGEGCDAHSHVQVLVLVRARPISFHKHLPAAAPHFAPGHWLESARPATRTTDRHAAAHPRQCCHQLPPCITTPRCLTLDPWTASCWWFCTRPRKA